ncbi:MAG TPA: type II secretion system F family protein [Actinomycetota bacterium]
MDPLIVVGAAVGIAGVVVMVRAARSEGINAAAVLAELDAHAPPVDEFEERLQQPLPLRILKPAGTRVVNLLRGFLPANYMERLRHRLVVSGLSDRYGPEEFMAFHALSVAGGVLAGLVVPALLGWSTAGILRALAVTTALGFVLPLNSILRAKEARQLQVRRDLPDILDLLAISVEAGMGLEGAIEVVTDHFDSPLAHELGRMLREMELGVSRRNALQNLKARVEVQEVSNFVLSLVQADALGMPIGRVLRTQAAEMRSKRRQWARERAAKLPVKILFPLMMFILPALFAIVLGPAILSIKENILR